MMARNLENGNCRKYIWNTTARNFSNKRKCRRKWKPLKRWKLDPKEISEAPQKAYVSPESVG